MITCRSCGRPNDASDQYCRACGAALSADADGGRPAGDPPGPSAPDRGTAMLDLDAVAPSRARGRRQTTTRRVPWWAPLGAVAALVALVAWPVVSDRLGGDADEAASSDAVEPAGDSAPSSTPSSTSDIEPSPTVLRDRPAEGEPIAPDATGLSVFVGSAVELVRIDLDTGVQRRFDAPGEPVHVTGDWLVVTDSDGASSRFVDTRDPEARRRRTVDEPQAWLLDIGQAPDPGQLWVLVDTNNSSVTEWRLVDLDSQEVLRTIPFSSNPSSFVDDNRGIGREPEFARAADGGLYALADTQGAEPYRSLGPGRLLAVADDALLIERCVEPTRCASRWFGLDGQTLLDDGEPAIDGWISSADVEASDDGKTIAWSDPFDGGTVVDYMTGTDTYTFTATWDPPRPSVSPDGRYVVAVDTAPFLLDVETGEVTPLPVPMSLRRGEVGVVLYQRTDDGLSPAPADAGDDGDDGAEPDQGTGG